jgi:hypothetical protein
MGRRPLIAMPCHTWRTVRQLARAPDPWSRTEEVNESDADETEASPDEEHLGLQVRISRTGINQIWCRVGNSPVQEPVGCSRHGEAFGTRLEREELA